MEQAPIVVAEQPVAGLVVDTDKPRVVIASAIQPVGIRQDAPHANVVRNEQTLRLVVPQETRGQIVRMGFMGPQGIPGSGGSASQFYVNALTNLTWPAVVAIVNNVAHYADPTNPADMQAQLAITLQGVSAGSPVLVTLGGQQLTESAWNWTPGRIFLGLSNGQLTQNLDPSIGAVVEVARAITPTTIELGIQTAILR